MPIWKKKTVKQTIRRVPINDELMLFFREMKLVKYPKLYYVFGSPFKAGMGNRGAGSIKWDESKPEASKTGVSGAMHPDFLASSANHVKRDTVTKLFKKIVKDILQIDKYMYAMKHTGADDKIMAGIDLDALKQLYGHQSKQMTEKYARHIKEVYKEQLTKQVPAFVS